MPVEHNTRCTRARVSLIFFLMTRGPINFGEIMFGEMARTWFGRKIKSYFYGNLLTQYMLSREVLEYPRYDNVVKSSKGLIDITSLLDTTTKLNQTAWNECDEDFNKNIFGSLNLLMRRIGVTGEKWTVAQ